MHSQQSDTNIIYVIRTMSMKFLTLTASYMPINISCVHKASRYTCFNMSIYKVIYEYVSMKFHTLTASYMSINISCVHKASRYNCFNMSIKSYNIVIM